MKSIFASKTFWANILMGAVGYLGSGSLNPKWALPAAGAINVVLRWLTSVPVSVP